MRVFLATFLLCACSQALGQGTPAKSARIAHLTIVGINDVHGALLEAPPHKSLARYTGEPVGGADWFAGWVAAIRSHARERGGEAIVLDGGDEFQGTLISNKTEGRSVVDVFNRIGLTAAAVGNHEFDFGLDSMKARFAQASYPFLCAIVFEKGTRKRPSWARPSVLVTVGGVQVGIVGLTTVETHTSTNPAIISGLEFVPGGPVAAQEADALRARGATIVLLVAHVGPLPPSQEIQQVAEAVRGKVDAIVSGHNHIEIGPPPLVAAGIPVVQSGSRFAAFSIIEIAIDPATGRAAGFAVNDGTYPRPGGPQPIFHGFEGAPAAWQQRFVSAYAAVAGIVAKYDEQVKRLRETPVGETLVDLCKSGRKARSGTWSPTRSLRRGRLAARRLRAHQRGRVAHRRGSRGPDRVRDAVRSVPLRQPPGGGDRPPRRASRRPRGCAPRREEAALRVGTPLHDRLGSLCGRQGHQEAPGGSVDHEHFRFGRKAPLLDPGLHGYRLRLGLRFADVYRLHFRLPRQRRRRPRAPRRRETGRRGGPHPGHRGDLREAALADHRRERRQRSTRVIVVGRRERQELP
jgi:2',3'-cyclic-nucleotide 2'-phosphodiesterase (5'-nucleotidase family)